MSDDRPTLAVSTNDLFDLLIRIAIGSIPHRNLGGCPHEQEHASRDRNCAACNILLEAEDRIEAEE